MILIIFLQNINNMNQLLIYILYSLYWIFAYYFEGRNDGFIIKNDKKSGDWLRQLKIISPEVNMTVLTNEEKTYSENVAQWHIADAWHLAFHHLFSFVVMIFFIGTLKALMLLICSVAIRILVHSIVIGYIRGQKFNTYSTCDSCDLQEAGWKFWKYGYDFSDCFTLQVKNKLGIEQYEMYSCLFLISSILYFLI